MAYGDPEPTPEQQRAMQMQYQQDSMYPDEYMYPGDMWRGKPSGDQAAQVREALFGCTLPSEKDFEEWFPTLQAAIDLVARVPGFDSSIYAELNRDMEDLVDRANSQGRRKIVASKMQKFIFKLRSLVPKGDVPLAGVTGVTAMITTTQNVKQDIRMPQQPAPSSFLGDVRNLLPGGKK